jgi:hypothetical protein
MYVSLYAFELLRQQSPTSPIAAAAGSSYSATGGRLWGISTAATSEQQPAAIAINNKLNNNNSSSSGISGHRGAALQLDGDTVSYLSGTAATTA